MLIFSAQLGPSAVLTSHYRLVQSEEKRHHQKTPSPPCQAGVLMMDLWEPSRTGPASDSSVPPSSADKIINTRVVPGGAVSSLCRVVTQWDPVCCVLPRLLLTSDTGVAIFLLGIKSLLKPYVVILYVLFGDLGLVTQVSSNHHPHRDWSHSADRHRLEV